MTDNPHFEKVPSIQAAGRLVSFAPLELNYTAGFGLESVSVHVRDHKNREVGIADRSVEAHYGAFGFAQSRHAAGEAQRLATSVSYGLVGNPVEIGGCPGQIYELGPEPEDDDIDGRAPAVVTWHDGELFYLLASDQLTSAELRNIAGRVYHSKGKRR